jgi:hypothetical protein
MHHIGQHKHAAEDEDGKEPAVPEVKHREHGKGRMACV